MQRAIRGRGPLGFSSLGAVQREHYLPGPLPPLRGDVYGVLDPTVLWLFLFVNCC